LRPRARLNTVLPLDRLALNMEQDWSALAAHPAVQGALIPFGVALVATGLLRLGASLFNSGWRSGLGISLGFLVSVWLLAGIPQAAPLSAVHKLALIGAGGSLVGAISEWSRVTPRVLRPLAVGLFLAAALWLAWPQLQRGAVDWPVAVVALGCGAVLYGLGAPAQRPAHDSAPLLLVAAGIAGIAVVSGSLVIAQLGVALATACGGFLVWNWPRARDSLGASVLLGAWLPAAALALTTILLTPAPPWSFAPLVAVFLLAPLGKRLWRPKGLWREALQPIYTLVLGLVPIALSVALALLAESPDDVYYR